ncbi:rCG36617 [Rattus norvegicus]|uniref:RCG36617 n=1 Tax=Rattus norvegicus TaxID=10116 RepID=A6JS77_RAT|nr:rCG36617 [Rattus norvegicus]
MSNGTGCQPQTRPLSSCAGSRQKQAQPCSALPGRPLSETSTVPQAGFPFTATSNKPSVLLGRQVPVLFESLCTTFCFPWRPERTLDPPELKFQTIVS